jgi:predicted DNA-binding protein
MKTLAIRLEDEQHARLSILAKLSGVSLTDTIREAIDNRIATLAADPKIAAKAETLTAEIDREAAEQRDAIATLFGTSKRTTSRGRQSAE